MPKKKNFGFVYWFPRIFGLIFALFLMVFSLDVFDSSSGFWMTVLAFLIHSIPSIVLFIIVAISWKYEIVGAIGFILLSLIFAVFTVLRTDDLVEMLISISIIGLSVFIIGIFFLIGFIRKH